MSFHKVGDTNFWDSNFFDPKAMSGPVVRPKRNPSPIPDTRMLFDIQDDLIKTIAALRALPHEIESKDTYTSDLYKSKRKMSLYQAENAYKLINRYLRQYVNVGGQGAL